MIVASTPSERASADSSSHCSGADRKNHPLLGFGDPDFGVRQALVLDRGLVEPHFGADLLAHLAHRAREAAGAAIGDRVIQARGRGPASITSSTIFSVIALPICTAPPERLSLWWVSSAELNVAP